MTTRPRVLAACLATAVAALPGPARVSTAAMPDAGGLAPPASAPKDDATFRPDIPDVPVFDQHGRRLRFRSDLLKDRTVAVNFIFTTCTTVCPALTASMRGLQRALAGRVGRDVWLVSVSVDPSVDRPERLRAFADTFGAGPGWTFVTGDKPDIDRLLRAFGTADAAIGAHTTTLLVGDERTGRWVRSSGLAPAATNVALILEAAGPGGQF